MMATRAARALRHPGNWVELGKFSVVGASGYLVNLAVYGVLLRAAGLHYLAAGACSFVVAATNNYVWNRHWTFRRQRGHVYYQGLRFRSCRSSLWERTSACCTCSSTPASTSWRRRRSRSYS
jgi:putative flippase GtrA